MRHALFMVMLLTSLPCYAQERTILKYYDPRSSSIIYRDALVVAQAARFENPSPGSIRRIDLMLQGARGNGEAVLHIYGGEAGADAPLLEHDLVRPVVVKKTKAGVEKVSITFADPVEITSSQFFIVLDGMSPGMTLLSDRYVKKASCIDEKRKYYWQLLKDSSGRWSWGRYAYLIDVEFESRRIDEPVLADVTTDAAIPDSVLCNGSIAWGDYNLDGWYDILVGGKLLENRRNGRFVDVSVKKGVGEKPRANCFLDMNNDGRPDLLFIGTTDSTSTLYINQGDGSFARRIITSPPLPHLSTFSMADANGDGYLDLFIGQSAAAVGAQNYLMLNDGSLGFHVDTTTLGSRITTISTDGSQWVDLNEDARPDLCVVGRQEDGIIWVNGSVRPDQPDRNDSFWKSTMAVGRGAGCNWADFDNDGDPDLLLPRSIVLDTFAPAEMSGSDILKNTDGSHLASLPESGIQGLDYVEYRSGGAWGDADNDGLLDAVVTASCACSFVDLYHQTTGHGFEKKTFEYGLFRTSGGKDAVWADYDNDGDLDLSFVRDGRLRLYRNRGAAAGSHYVEIDLEGNRDPVGARVTVHTGERRYIRDVVSGRGILMQDPLRLHFGLADAASIDSVTVQWPWNDGVEKFTDVRIDAVNRIAGRNSVVAGVSRALKIEGFPNPFTSSPTISYTIPSDQHVRLQIYTLSGDQVATLVDAVETSGDHRIVWDPVADDGTRLPQGNYIYQLTAGGAEVHGSAMLTH